MLAYARWGPFSMCAHPALFRVLVMGTFNPVPPCFINAILSLQFVVLKFPPTATCKEELIEIGLRSWLKGDLNDDMQCQTYWPKDESKAPSYVRMQQDFKPDWDVYNVVVMRFYDSYLKARTALPKLTVDSNYETETEMGRGKRNRKKNAIYSSSDEEELVPKRSKACIPAPPPIDKSNAKKTKGQTVLSKAESRKNALEELRQRLNTARQAAAAKMNSKPSPKKVAGMTSPWRVGSLNKDSSKDQTKFTPVKVIDSSKDHAKSTPDHDLIRNNSEDMSTTPNTPADKSLDQGTFYDSPTENEFQLLRSNANLGKSPPGDGDQQSRAKSPNGTGSSSSRFPKNTTSTDEQERLDRQNTLTGADSPSPLSSSSIFSKSAERGTKTSRVLFPATDETDRNCCAGCKSLEIIVKRNAITLSEISSKCDLALMNLGRVSRSLLPNEKRITPPANMPKLPLSSKKELKVYESFLDKSDVNLAAVCDYMSSFVRTTVVDPERKSANRILPQLLTNSLAREINLEGGNSKIAFRSLKLYKVFLGTLQAAFRDSDMSIAEDALRRWLKDAKYRKQDPGASA